MEKSTPMVHQEIIVIIKHTANKTTCKYCIVFYQYYIKAPVQNEITLVFAGHFAIVGYPLDEIYSIFITYLI